MHRWRPPRPGCAHLVGGGFFSDFSPDTRANRLYGSAVFSISTCGTTLEWKRFRSSGLARLILHQDNYNIGRDTVLHSPLGTTEVHDGTCQK